MAGVIFPTQPVVEAQAPFGNLDTSFAGAVTVTIRTGTGTAGATLAGTTSVVAAGGLITYTDLTINKAGTGYQLVAASGTFTTAVSAAFDIAKGNQTISFGALLPKVYGDPPFVVTATASSGLPVTYSTSGNCTNAGSTITITGAGSCTVTASQLGDANYNAASPV